MEERCTPASIQAAHTMNLAGQVMRNAPLTALRALHQHPNQAFGAESGEGRLSAFACFCVSNSSPAAGVLVNHL